MTTAITEHLNMISYERLSIDIGWTAKWVPLNVLPNLAFDHDKILADAMRVLKING